MLLRPEKEEATREITSNSGLECKYAANGRICGVIASLVVTLFSFLVVLANRDSAMKDFFARIDYHTRRTMEVVSANVNILNVCILIFYTKTEKNICLFLFLRITDTMPRGT